MKLSNLHSSSPYRTIAEEVDPSKEEKLAYIHMMVARQGKNPDEIMSKLRGMVDPDFAKKEGYKKSLSRWVQSAQKDDSKEGMAFGKRVRVTVLESAVREMIIEGYFRGIGTMVVNKLKEVLDKGRDESEFITKYVDEYPSLAAIQRHAKRSKTPIYDDEKFWQLVDEVTHGKGQKIRTLMKHQFERDSSMTSEGLTEGIILRNPLSEITIVEAKISRVISSLGIDPEEVKNIMAKHEIRDEDYDLSRLKSGYDSAVQAVKAGAGRAKEGIAGVAGRAKEGIASAAGRAKEGIAGAARDVAGGAKATIGNLAAGPKAAEKERDIRNENDDLSDYIIKTAYALMKLDEADADTPEEASRVLDKALMTGPSDETREAGNPDIIEPSALRGIGSPSY